MKILTKAEEQIMQVLWKIEKGFLREITNAMPGPKPHQNTVATLLKILIEKEFVSVTVLGRQHLYSPIITKDEYSRIVSAHQKGVTPPWNTKLGGEIFIHGRGSSSDWTWGCVALDDSEMKELFQIVEVGTVVEIKK